MKVRITPSHTKGFVHSNISKSDAHRALICAALANGKSHIRFHGLSQDIKATIDALGQLGATIRVDEEEVTVCGTDPKKVMGQEIYCGESGSTLRFLIPVFALADQPMGFTGAGRLMERPMSVYQQFFADNGLPFEQLDGRIALQGPIQAGEYTLDGAISSQFFTGLLLALPLADGDSVIHIREPFESQSYLHMTLKVLKAFGVQAQLVDHDLIIPGGQQYQPTDYTVEADYSSAAFFGLLGALNGPITMDHLDANSLQGDRVFFDWLAQAGASVNRQDDCLTVSPGPLHYLEVDLADCPDLGPAAIILGALSHQGMKLQHIARLRYKESDRIAAMAEELAKLGYRLEADENSAWIPPQSGMVSTDTVILDGHNDHRIVMALAIAACCGPVPVIIEGAGSVNKSYPQFFADLSKVKGNLEVYDD